MATYLSGITDYIPDYQPFQPDLNFYANVLQTKQTQYDNNWKSLNNIYAEMRNADLTHDKNVKKKDELLKQIDFNVKRIAGLDLSLQQNVDQATQIFRPYYEDKYLMKDMAWTKNKNSTISRALNLKNSQDEKMRGQYWDPGIKEIQYRTEEFKKATLDETLNMGNVTYTPFVSSKNVYDKIFKDSGLSMDVKDVDETGMYFVREKNGQKLIPALQKLFRAAYENNPQLQAVKATEAYLERKDYAKQNASKFNGNELEAEKEYLRDQYKFLQNYTKEQNKTAQEDVTVTKNKLKEVENTIGTEDETIGSMSFVDQLNKAMSIDQTVANHTEKLNNQLNGDNVTTLKSSTRSTDPDVLDLSDMELARIKVDSGMASVYAQKEIMAMADAKAYTNYVYEKSVNPVGLENMRHQHALSRIGYTHQLKTQEIQLKSALDRERDRIKFGMETGTMFYDKDGQLQELPGGSYEITLGSKSGMVTDVQNAERDRINSDNKNTLDFTSDYIGRTLLMLDNLASSDSKITDRELWNALSWLDPNSKDAYDRYNTRSGRELLSRMITKRNADPTKFDLSFSKNNQVLKLKKYMDNWAMKNSQTDAGKQYLGDPNLAKIQQYVIHREAAKVVEEHNNNVLSKELKETLATADFNIKKPETKEKLVNAYMDYMRSTGNPTVEGFEKYVDKKLGYQGAYKREGLTSKGQIENLGLNGKTKLIDTKYESGFGSVTGIDMDDLFETLSDTRLKTFTSGKTLSYKGPIRNLGDGKYGYAADKITALDVNLKNPSWGGFQDFHQVMSDINRINFSQDSKRYAVTVGGLTKTAATTEEDKISPALAKTILNELRTSTGKKSKYGTFTMGRASVAREDQNTGALIIKPPREILEKYIRKKDDKSKVDYDKIEKIMQFGISFMAPKNEWTNDFFLENELTPTQQLLNAKPIKYVSPYNAGKFEIKKQTNVPGVDYSLSMSANIILPDGRIDVQSNQLLLGKYGNNIDVQFATSLETLNKINAQNNKIYRELKAAGNTEAIQKIDAFFNKPVNNPGFN
jgi:hypothetical protein